MIENFLMGNSLRLTKSKWTDEVGQTVQNRIMQTKETKFKLVTLASSKVVKSYLITFSLFGRKNWVNLSDFLQYFYLDSLHWHERFFVCYLFYKSLNATTPRLYRFSKLFRKTTSINIDASQAYHIDHNHIKQKSFLPSTTLLLIATNASL